MTLNYFRNFMDENRPPITLKKRPQNKPTQRSKSVPRRGSQSIAVRNLYTDITRENKRRVLQKKFEKEKTMDIKPALTPVKPVIFNRSSLVEVDSYWDSSGCLILDQDSRKRNEKGQVDLQYEIRKTNPIKRSNSMISNGSRGNQKKQDSSATVQVSIFDRVRPPSRAQSVVSSPRKNKSRWNEFLKRQDECLANRERLTFDWKRKEDKQHEQSFISKESRQIVQRARSQASSRNPSPANSPRHSTPKKKIEEEKYSFKPDRSLTKDTKAYGLSCRYSEARTVLRDIKLQGIRVEKEIEEYRECTFRPDLSSTSKTAKKASYSEVNESVMNKKKIRQEKILEERKRKQEEETRQNRPIRRCPRNTKKSNEFLSELAEEKRTERKPYYLFH
ncbi:hypothetical protein TRFO_09772 [Tritrichomonas foetus]|uniref:Uncharacterized protein n=1 Tax=Tritrichomonas foetus TaxID=1144522 RepID=A0A1J4JCN4_9EUKA|nr:hypothetical protein TRFO_09772 [Tritrichomonas foetus]|eukprot:OHS96864.1 hypothetical protein TRFO_09772 [Tritrichomonas foetus]